MTSPAALRDLVYDRHYKSTGSNDVRLDVPSCIGQAGKSANVGCTREVGCLAISDEGTTTLPLQPVSDSWKVFYLQIGFGGG